MNADKRKQLKNDYKNKPVVGAVYALSCGDNGHRIIRSTVDIAAIKNRFQFALAIKSCPDPALCGEWSKYGAEACTLEVLEELKMGKEQTPKEFAEDIKLLYEMWLEKLAPADSKEGEKQ